MTPPKRQAMNYWRFIVPLIFIILAGSRFVDGQEVVGTAVLVSALGMTYFAWRSLSKEQHAYDESHR